MFKILKIETWGGVVEEIINLDLNKIQWSMVRVDHTV